MTAVGSMSEKRKKRIKKMNFETNEPMKIVEVSLNGTVLEELKNVRKMGRIEVEGYEEVEEMKREQFLDEAKKCVCTDREEQYGTPEDNFALIAAFWNMYLESKYPEIEYSSVIEACDVAMMMALLKVARIATGKPKADNFVDLIGYAACAGEIQLKEVW